MPARILSETGSSPLTRGKQQVDVAEADVLGLIPAHAGKTRRFRRSYVMGFGSSPLTRGKPIMAKNKIEIPGLIPAHAGKTLGRVGGLNIGGAHPRSRGENILPLT